jgi:hypothetical protein
MHTFSPDSTGTEVPGAPARGPSLPDDLPRAVALSRRILFFLATALLCVIAGYALVHLRVRAVNGLALGLLLVIAIGVSLTSDRR